MCEVLVDQRKNKILNALFDSKFGYWLFYLYLKCIETGAYSAKLSLKC